jgi:hypothetical protein
MSGNTSTAGTAGNWLMGINLAGYGSGFNIRSNALGTQALFTVSTQGNDGIGTGTPSYKLEVNGSMYSSSISTSSLLATTSISTGQLSAVGSTFGTIRATDITFGTLLATTSISSGQGYVGRGMPFCPDG